MDFKESPDDVDQEQENQLRVQHHFHQVKLS